MRHAASVDLPAPLGPGMRMRCGTGMVVIRPGWALKIVEPGKHWSPNAFIPAG